MQMPNPFLKSALFDEKAVGEGAECDAAVESDFREAEFDKLLELSDVHHRLAAAVATLEGLVQALQEKRSGLI